MNATPVKCACKVAATEIAYLPTMLPSVVTLRFAMMSLTMMASPASAYEHSLSRRAALVPDQCRLFFDFAIRIELLDIGPQIVDLPRIGDTGESHFRAWDSGLRTAD